MPNGTALQAYLTRLDEVRCQIEGTGNGTGAKVWGATADFLRRVQHRLTRPPRIAIVGEANTGKTTLANILLGQELLTTDIVNNTRAPILVRYADHVHLCGVDPSGKRKELSHDTVGRLRRDTFTSLELGLPLAALRQFEIIDTPGVSVLGENLDRMAFVCRQADMAVWCTLATQAWRASERELWLRVGERTRMASLLAVTHADALSASEQARVGERLQREAAPLFADVSMVARLDAVAAISAPHASALPTDLAAAFGQKLAAALERVEQHRLLGARRAVHRFMQGLDHRGDAAMPHRGDAAMPLEPMQVAA